MAAPMMVRFPRAIRSSKEDLNGTCKKQNRSKDHGGDALAVVSRLRMTAAAGSEPEMKTETRQRFNGEWLQQQL